MSETKDLAVNSGKDITVVQAEQLDQMNVVAKAVTKNIKKDRDKAEDLYAFMEDLIDINNDKSPGSREAMAKAVELKMKGTDQLIELLKIKAKLINPAKGVEVNINLGDYDEKRGSDTSSLISLVDDLKAETNENY